MKDKGFTMVETIVMIAFLSISLLIVYKSFVSTLELNKERAKFNNTNYIYRTNIIYTYFKDNGLLEYINTTTFTKGFIDVNCDITSLTNKEYCNLLYKNDNLLDIKKIIVYKSDVQLSDDLEPSLIAYLKTINSTSGGYRLVVWFNDNEIASLKLKEING